MKWRVAVPSFVVGLAFAGSVPAQADAVPATREDRFRAWDRDGDGTLSRGEYPGHPGNFRALDTNGDHVLSREEFQHRGGAAAPAEEVDEFGAKDHDRNGVITRDEWPDHPVFSGRDVNRDGQVTRDEYYNVNAKTTVLRGSDFDRLDRNNDGVISRKEWPDGATRFDRFDTNDDGEISRREYAKAAPARK